MDLRCVARYSSDYGTFAPGDAVEGSDDFKRRLLRDSPTSFEVVSAEPVPEPEESPFGAMSTETATGLVKPDRRARGGLKR